MNQPMDATTRERDASTTSQRLLTGSAIPDNGSTNGSQASEVELKRQIMRKKSSIHVRRIDQFILQADQSASKGTGTFSASAGSLKEGDLAMLGDASANDAAHAAIGDIVAQSPN